MADYAWKGANTLLGAAGTAMSITALAIKQGKNNCRNGNGDGEDCYITRTESKLRAENAELRADSKTDAKILELYNVVAANKEAAGEQIAKNAVQIALNEQASNFRFEATQREFAAVRNETSKELGCLKTYVDSNFQPIAIKEPLYSCAPVSIQGAIIDTSETKTSATVVGNKKA